MQLSLCIGNMAEAVTLELKAGLSKNRLTPPWPACPPAGLSASPGWPEFVAAVTEQLLQKTTLVA